jgi:predicted DNA-binding transcriptional regulator YafY
MKRDESPTARALLALEVIQGSAGVTAERLAERLGMSERAARRYIGMDRMVVTAWGVGFGFLLSCSRRQRRWGW